MKHLYCAPDAKLIAMSSANDIMRTSGNQSSNSLEGMLDIHTDIVDRVSW